jgi:adenylosuccinate synthase
VTARADVILGCQWGDEGKGRVIDLYAADYDVVARFAGGDNAGHSIVVGDRELALRIVPSGVLQPHVELFIGGGTVVNTTTLLGELDKLEQIGVDIERVRISDRAHVVLPYHAERDAAAERARGGAALGTTGRGIGPAYVDRVARSGLRFADFAQPRRFADAMRAAGASGDAIEAALRDGERLRSYIVDGVEYLQQRLRDGKRVLLEGAQGTLLDVGYGTYPYVTSSHTIAGGACTGLGMGPHAIGKISGVFKAYCTRVGAGPFPSELHDERGERLRKQGGEFGTVTGRPRRCGWFDAVAARYAVALNSLDSAIITKLDVLSGLERVGVVTGYRLDGAIAGFSAAADEKLELEIEELPGWQEPIEDCRRIADLPATARAYVDRLRDVLEVPIDLVSVGRERSQLAR